MSADGQDTIYQLVTDRLVEALAAGTVPWHMSWSVNGTGPAYPMRMSSGTAYRGVNVWLLGVTAMTMGYTSPWWGTFDQIAKLSGMVQEPMMRNGKPLLYLKGKLKGQPRLHWVSPDGTERGVRKDEKSTIVVLNRRFTWEDKNDLDDQGKPKRKVGYTLRYYRVFNADQAAQMPERYLAPAGPVTEPEPFAGVAAADDLIAGYLVNGPRIVHDEPGRAWYKSGPDMINLPPDSAFESVGERYSTWFHEVAHSTGHPDRLNRRGIANFDHFGSGQYAQEELVAEIGCAMLCAVTEIDGVFDNSAAYIAGWLRTLKGDSTVVVHAAGQAQRAADLVRGITYNDETGE
jgi:antirestriction protein ArdC